MLERMQDWYSDATKYAYSVSAYMSAATAVINVLSTEYKRKDRPKFKKWWLIREGELKKIDVYEYLNTHRNRLTHEIPLKTSDHGTVHQSEAIFTFTGTDGTIRPILM